MSPARPATDARRRTIVRGDFQTPPALVQEVCRTLTRLGVQARSLLEPTCGRGAFLTGALEHFEHVQRAVGVELDAAHARAARAAVRRLGSSARVTIRNADAFAFDWQAQLAALPDPLLLLGNPPWVTNSELGALGSDARPPRRNTPGRRGIEALTGAGNFDVSEWLLRRWLEQLPGRDATLAVLCKTAVARRALGAVWAADGTGRASLHRIGAATHFGVSVDACLLVVRFDATRPAPQHECPVYPDLDSEHARSTLGAREGIVVADVTRYDRWQHVQGDSGPRWRSGVKHDCARVMELRPAADMPRDDTPRDGATHDGATHDRAGTSRWINGLGETVELEHTHVFPLLKSSDVAHGRGPTRWMLVPQRHPADDTAPLEHVAPLTWRYLQAHRAALDARASRLYRGRPAFAIFGVGEYTFAPWKVAVSGLYKSFAFRAVGPHAGRPVVFDDTVAFAACEDERAARALAALLCTPEARDFFAAFSFPDAKRPVRIELLQRLDPERLARAIARGTMLA